MSEATPHSSFAEEGKRVGRNTFFLIGSRLAGMLLALVQTAIIGNSLSVEGSGQFLFAMGYSALFTVFATLGVQRVLVRDIAQHPDKAWDYVWSAVAMIGVLTALVLGALAFSTVYLVDDPVKRAAVVLASFSIVGLWALQRPFEAVLIAHERMGWLAWVNLAGALLKVSAIALAFAWMDEAWMPWGSAVAHGAIAAANAVVFLLCVCFALYVGGLHTPRIMPYVIFRQIKECIPLSLAALFSLVYFKADIFLLERFRGDIGVGIYFPVQRLMEPLLMIAGLWGTAVFPALCRLAHVDAENFTTLKQTSLRLAIILAMPMALGIMVLAPLLVDLLVGPEALVGASTQMMQWYAVIIPLFFFNGLAQEILYAAHRNWFVVVSYAVAATVSVSVNLYALSHYGYIGLCFAAIASNLAVSGFFVYGLHKEIGGLHLPTLLIKVGTACALMGLVALEFAALNLFLAAGAGAMVYLMLLILLHAFNPVEQEMLLGLFGRKTKKVDDNG